MVCQSSGWGSRLWNIIDLHYVQSEALRQQALKCQCIALHYFIEFEMLAIDKRTSSKLVHNHK